jgi:hypothetical protein
MNNFLSHPRRAILGRLLLAAALSGVTGAMAAPTTHIGEPIFAWKFWEIESDGLGDTLEPIEAVNRLRQGGTLDESFRLTPGPVSTPHARVFSDAGAITFWTEVTSPNTSLFPPKHTVIGGKAELSILQTYRKDEADGSIKFTINSLMLRGLELGGPSSNVGLEGEVSFSMRAYDVTDDRPPFEVIDRFDSLTRLSGRGLDWDMDNTGPLAVDVVRGSLSGPSATIGLLSPYSRAIDLSAIPVGGVFTVEFTTITSAFDTVQFDSRMQAFGRDPLAPASGSFFEIEGLTPMNVGLPTAVPEPETYALMLAGLALLAARRHGGGRAARR